MCHSDPRRLEPPSALGRKHQLKAALHHLSHLRPGFPRAVSAPTGGARRALPSRSAPKKRLPIERQRVRTSTPSSLIQPTSRSRSISRDVDDVGVDAPEWATNPQAPRSMKVPASAQSTGVTCSVAATEEFAGTHQLRTNHPQAERHPRHRASTNPSPYSTPTTAGWP